MSKIFFILNIYFQFFDAAPDPKTLTPLSVSTARDVTFALFEKMADRRAANETTSRFCSLYLGYPCSVDAGINPVEYTKMIIKHIKQLREAGPQFDEKAQKLREQLCELIPTCNVASNDDELIEKAEKLKEAWGYAVSEDKTMMGSDIDLVAECSQEMGFSKNCINDDQVGLKVIEEFQDEHISNVQSFLSCIPTPENGTM